MGHDFVMIRSLVQPGCSCGVANVPNGAPRGISQRGRNSPLPFLQGAPEDHLGWSTPWERGEIKGRRHPWPLAPVLFKMMWAPK